MDLTHDERIRVLEAAVEALKGRAVMDTTMVVPLAAQMAHFVEHGQVIPFQEASPGNFRTAYDSGNNHPLDPSNPHYGGWVDRGTGQPPPPLHGIYSNTIGGRPTMTWGNALNTPQATCAADSSAAKTGGLSPKYPWGPDGPGVAPLDSASAGRNSNG